jgi:hypothetical protein
VPSSFGWNTDVEDIGHVIATALKKQYKDSKGYKDFTELASKGASRLRQTDLTFITAPKLRAKGRFQSISKLAAWGDKILTVLAVKGAAKKGSLLARVREALLGFSRLNLSSKVFLAPHKRHQRSWSS